MNLSIFTDVAHAIIGVMSIVVFLSYWFWAIIGFIINLLVDIMKREKGSINSPVKLSFKYWIEDNGIRLLISFLLIPIALVFFNTFIGTDLNNLTAFFLGFSSDYLIEILKRKAIIPGMPTKK